MAPKGFDEAGLADARLSPKQNDLTLARSHPGPAIDEDLQLMIPAEDGRARAFGPRPGAAAGLGRIERLEGLHRSVEPLQRQWLQRSVGELSCGNPLRRLGDDYAARRRRALQPRREVRRLPDDPDLADLAAADEVADHHEAGGDADSRLTGDSVRQGQASHRPLQSESSPNGMRSVFFVGAWVAEIGEHAVAHVFGDVTSVVRDDVVAGRPKHLEDMHHVLGIQRIGKRNRADDIAKQDG